MKKKILIIEDEKSLANLVGETLEKEGFQIVKAYDGETGLEKFYDEKPDLIILDINMPKKNGLDVCREIRENSNIPILMVTARTTEFDEIHGLELGADDYITKPFNLKVLVIKVKKQLHLDSGTNYKYKGLEIDFNNQVVTVDGNAIELSKKEFAMLTYFVNNKNRILTREIIMNEIWGFNVFVDDRTVDTLIMRVRKKLLEYSDIIETLRGVGYRYNEV